MTKRGSESARRWQRSLSLRGGLQVRRGNPSCLEGRDRRMRFAYWFTVDRHGLRPRDDKMWSESVYRSRTTHHVIARRKRSERRGNPSCLECRARGMRFVYRGPVDRHGHFSMPSRWQHTLSLRGTKGSDWRGNPSCLDRRFRVCPFSYWSTVDRHRVRPRKGELVILRINFIKTLKFYTNLKDMNNFLNILF